MDLKGFKGMFIKEDPVASVVQKPPHTYVPPAAVRPVAAVPSRPASAAGAPSASPTDASVDPGMLQKLQEAIDASHVPGYAEFFGQLEALADVIPDEAQRFRAALKSAAKAHGSTLQGVTSSIDDRLGILSRELTEGLNAFDQQCRGEVADKHAQVQDLSKKITAKKAELERLQNEIRELESEEQTASAEIAGVTASYEAGKKSFQTTVATVRRQLQDQKDKLVRFLR